MIKIAPKFALLSKDKNSDHLHSKRHWQSDDVPLSVGCLRPRTLLNPQAESAPSQRMATELKFGVNYTRRISPILSGNVLLEIRDREIITNDYEKFAFKILPRIDNVVKHSIRRRKVRDQPQELNMLGDA